MAQFLARSVVRSGRRLFQQVFEVGADLVRLAQAGPDRRQGGRAPESLTAGADEFEIAMFLRKPEVERKAHELEIGRARPDIQHILDEDLVGQRLLLFDDVFLELSEFALAEARNPIVQHPLAIEHRNLAVGAEPLDERGFQFGIGCVGNIGCGSGSHWHRDGAGGLRGHDLLDLGGGFLCDLLLHRFGESESVRQRRSRASVQVGRLHTRIDQLESVRSLGRSARSGRSRLGAGVIKRAANPCDPSGRRSALATPARVVSMTGASPDSSSAKISGLAATAASSCDLEMFLSAKKPAAASTVRRMGASYRHKSAGRLHQAKELGCMLPARFRCRKRRAFPVRR